MSKRVLCALAIVGAAFVATPAQAAAPDLPVTVTVNDDEIAVRSGVPGQPLVSVVLDRNTGVLCVGFSKQIPFCVGGPIN